MKFVPAVVFASVFAARVVLARELWVDEYVDSVDEDADLPEAELTPETPSSFWDPRERGEQPEKPTPIEVVGEPGVRWQRLEPPPGERVLFEGRASFPLSESIATSRLRSVPGRTKEPEVDVEEDGEGVKRYLFRSHFSGPSLTRDRVDEDMNAFVRANAEAFGLGADDMLVPEGPAVDWKNVDPQAPSIVRRQYKRYVRVGGDWARVEADALGVDAYDGEISFVWQRLSRLPPLSGISVLPVDTAIEKAVDWLSRRTPREKWTSRTVATELVVVAERPEPLYILSFGILKVAIGAVTGEVYGGEGPILEIP